MKIIYKPYNGPKYENPDHRAYLEKICRKEVEQVNEKPVWKMYEFWAPIIAGVAASLAFLFQEGLGITVDAQLFVSLITMAVSAILGVSWAVATVAKATAKKVEIQLRSRSK